MFYSSLMREREIKNSLILVDYENALLFPAIERVAGPIIIDYPPYGSSLLF